MKGDPVDFERILDPDYLVRYDACERILEANGIPVKLTEIRRVFSKLVSDGPCNAETRQCFSKAREELILFIQQHGKPLDYGKLAPKEVNEYFLDACYSIAAKPDVGRIRELLEHGADITARDERGFSAFCNAVHIFDFAVMELFLARGADINEVIRYSDKTSTIWLEKVAYADLASLQLMLKHGARVNDRDGNGNTPLINYCSGNPSRDGVLLLLNQGASAALVNDEGNSALHGIARQNTDRDSVQGLIDHGAEVNRPNLVGDTPLHINARFFLAGNESIAACLLDNGADPDLKNPEGDTALILAARCEKEAVVKTLVEHGAKKDLRDAKGKTALDIALGKGFIRIACAIDPSAKETYAKSPALAAVKKMKAEIVKKLKNGLKQYRSDKEGYSEFSWRDGAYRYDRFENGASPPDVSTYLTDEEALRFLYETNRHYSSSESEKSIYQGILNSLK